MEKKIIVKDGKIIATHELYQDIEHLYPDCEYYVFDPKEYQVEDTDNPGATRKVKSGDDLPTLSDEHKLYSLRYYRNDVITKSDWRILEDAPITEEQKTAWETYRQYLRDLPDNINLETDSIKEKINLNKPE